MNNRNHAVDYGTDNTWNSSTIGNYWDNHTGPDISPPYGIVDTQYNISGPAGSIDYLPIAEDDVPTIIINSPTDDDVFGRSSPSFNVRITDVGLDTMWYTLDGGLNNYTFTDNGTINPTAWAGFIDGPVTITFYANDTIGHLRFVDMNIIKDTIAPTINISSPEEGEVFGNTSPSFNITVTDPHLEIIWYTVDSGVINYTITDNTIFNLSTWAVLPEGNVTIMFYARDTLGNEASEDVTVIKSISTGGLDTGVIIIIVVVSVIGGFVVISIVYIIMKKRIASV